MSIADRVFVQVSHVENLNPVIRAIAEGIAFVQFVLVDFGADTVFDEFSSGIAVREADLVVFFQFTAVIFIRKPPS